MTQRAHPNYAGGSPRARAARDLLRAAMEREGFTVEPNEWWHFKLQGLAGVRHPRHPVQQHPVSGPTVLPTTRAPATATAR
jgi:D-alanyl-D-alanine dipeptidase